MADKKQLTHKQILARYYDYLDCFNSKDFEELNNYLSEQLYFYRGPGIPPFHARSEMFAFYKEAWSHFNENVTVNEIHFKKLNTSSSLHCFVASIVVHLQTFNSWIDGPYGTYLAGTEKHVDQNMGYLLDQEGMIIAIM